jgi:hypothetical protein
VLIYDLVLVRVWVAGDASCSTWTYPSARQCSRPVAQESGSTRRGAEEGETLLAPRREMRRRRLRPLRAAVLV